MSTQRSSPTPLAFGPFEVNAHTGELCKRGKPVRLSGQPFQILLLLVAKPGDLLTREELREQLWADGTFVDFDHGLNAAINKLRRALGDSADHPRYIENGTWTRLPFYRNPQSRDPSGSLRRANQRLSRKRELSGARAVRWSLAAVGVTAALMFVWASRSDDASPRQSPWTLTRLTADSGMSDDPALSPDGTLVAYSSDRSGANDRDLSKGALDLYVKHVAGGSPIRLTFDGAGNRTPDFSPDGSRIVFRSSRNGGGIYEMPALGGDGRLIAKDGFNPRFSPDGSQVAYWVGPESVATSVPGSGAVWVVSVGGGQPRRVAANFTTARYPIWHRDGKRLLISGYTSINAFDESGIDWWVVSSESSTMCEQGPTKHSSVLVCRRSAGRGRRVPAIPEPRCWASPENKIVFSIPAGDSWNLWQLELSPQTGKVVGSPQRLTTGAGSDLRASCAAGGTLAFAKVETRTDVWLLPFDLDRGVSTGVPQQITQGPPWHENPSLARDGRFLAFASDRSGRANIWLRELETGNEQIVAASTFTQRYPVSSPSGARIAFSVYEKDKRVVYMSAPGAAPEKLCEGCLRATDWSRDEKSVLVFAGDPYQISIVDLASRRQTLLVKHDDVDVLYGRFSPDNRWISFTARVSPSQSRIVVAPVEGAGPILEHRWITVAEVGPDDYALWSPDGKTLYSPLERMATPACGHNGSTPPPISRLARPLSYITSMDACRSITADGRRQPVESRSRWSKRLVISG